MLKRLRSRTVVPAALLAALVVAVAGLAACGPFGGSKSAKEIVDNTFSGEKKEVNSGKFSVSLKADNVKGLTELPDGSADAELSGAFDNGGNSKKFPKLDLSLTLKAGKTNISAGLITTETKAFVSYQSTPYEVPEQLFGLVKSGYEQAQRQQTQKKEKSKSANPGLDELGIKPRAWLTGLKKGEDTQVGGTDTYTVTGTVDVAKLAKDLSEIADKAPGGLSGLSSQLGKGQGKLGKSLDKDTIEKTINESVKSVEFTLNSGKDDEILRRMSLKIAFEVPRKFQKDLGGLQSGDIGFNVELAELNQPQAVKEPAGAKPLQELLTKLGLDKQAEQLGALSGLGGVPGAEGGTTPSPSTTTPSTPTTPPSSSNGGKPSTTTPTPSTPPTPPPSKGPASKAGQEYLKCVRKAKAPEDMRECVQKLQQQK